MDPRRRDLLVYARKLLRVPYENGAGLPVDGTRPAVVDCSAFVRWVAIQLLRTDTPLSPTEPWPTAYTMFHALAPTTAPLAGDLACYSRWHPRGRDEWHVMMVTEDGGAIGACNEARRVHQYAIASYSKTWRLQGFRSFPTMMDSKT